MGYKRVYKPIGAEVPLPYSVLVSLVNMVTKSSSCKYIIDDGIR